MALQPRHVAEKTGATARVAKILKRGRQKGRRVTRTAVQKALKRGANALFPLLNFDRPLRGDVALSSPLTDLGQTVEWLWTDEHREPAFLGFAASMMLQALAGGVVAFKGTRSPQMMLLLLGVLLTPPSPRSKWGATPVLLPLERFPSRAASLRQVAELLLTLYAESDDWLQRIRICRNERCRQFFLDPTRNYSKKCCKDSCKTEHHKSKKKPAKV